MLSGFKNDQVQGLDLKMSGKAAYVQRKDFQKTRRTVPQDHLKWKQNVKEGGMT